MSTSGETSDSVIDESNIKNKFSITNNQKTNTTTHKSINRIEKTSNKKQTSLN